MRKILISVSSNIPKDYENAINLVGGEADSFYLPKCIEIFKRSYHELLDIFSKEYDAFIISGGGDVHPEFYGEKVTKAVRIDLSRDLWERNLAEKFMGLRKPIMGICRGHQVMNVALGGTLKQDDGVVCNEIHTSPDSVFRTHNTFCKPSFLQDLFGAEFVVNSHHHQSLNKVADDLIPIQFSGDGCIEGVIHKSYPYIGVQWHPERLCQPYAREPGCIDGTRLFEYFMSLNSNRRLSTFCPKSNIKNYITGGSMENIITYKTTNIFSPSDLVSLFTSVGWFNESAKYPNRLENAMYHSDIVFSAWDGNKLVGLLSTISDTMHVYITYLLVNPSYQKRKIGTELINMFEKHYVNYKKELKTEKASDYYKRFGWHSDSIGMVKNDLPDYDY